MCNPVLKLKPTCPKCGAAIIRYVDGWPCCFNGHQTAPETFKTYKHTSHYGDNGNATRPVHTYRGPCSNCGRDKFYSNLTGKRCWKCEKAVKGLAPGTPEFTKALEDVIKEISSPKFKEYKRRVHVVRGKYESKVARG